MLGTPPAELDALGDLLALQLKAPEPKNPEPSNLDLKSATARQTS